jgi:beta-N-acetylhexosaminidase
LRGELGYRGVLFSDDLEMQAIAGHSSLEDSAVGALRAGCDMLLVCSSADAQRRAHAAVAATIAMDPDFRARCREAARRSLDMRREHGAPEPGTAPDFEALAESELHPLEAELKERLRALPSV